MQGIDITVNEFQVLQVEFFSKSFINPSLYEVEVGTHGIHGDLIFNQVKNDRVIDSRERSEEQGMVSNYQIESILYSIICYRGGHLESQQYVRHFTIHLTEQ